MITIHINTTTVTVTLTPITTKPMIKKQSMNSQYCETISGNILFLAIFNLQNVGTDIHV